MKRLLRCAVASAALGLVAVGAVRAQDIPLPGIDNTAFGTTSAEFLLLGAGARGAALGNSFAALATDPSALYWNPAGIAEMERPGLTLSTYEYLADTRYSWGGIAFPMMDGQSAIGMQIGSFGFSGQPVYSLRAPDGDGSTYDVSELFFGLTYAQNFSDRFSAGITGKVISDRLAKTAATAFAVDFGTSFHALIGERPIRASFVIANLGTGLRHDGVGLDLAVNRPPPPGQETLPQDPQPARWQSETFNLPVMFRVGLTYDFVNTSAARMTLLSSFQQPNNTNPSGGGGMEWALTDLGGTGFTVVARGSYTYQPDNSFTQDATPVAGFTTAIDGDDALDGLSAGGGIAFARSGFFFGVDYAYRHLGILGGTNVFSATIHW